MGRAHFNVRNRQGRVVIDINSDAEGVDISFDMDPDQAEGFAQLVTEHAQQARRAHRIAD